MTIAAILQNKGSDVVQVKSGDSMRSAVALLAERRIGCLPVVDGDEVVGIFSERDVVQQVASHGVEILDAPVSQVMTSPALTVTPTMSVLTALSLMTQRRLRHLPVIETGKMVGFVSIGDLVKYRIDRIESEASALRDYIQNV
ncbi:CBS domain-containing protein [Rhizorhapis sp. SPR117]|uniref:CBS domain-containing protein n=1 Tax=Rhizorhapis sp. SPR117 TaxID=2912611 RepID=UPI001F413322|nr:CBS domain-containing protein [Rhizorhapis sp. SPR117]